MNVHNLAARVARGPLAVLVLLCCCAANTLGQTGKREFTIEWIFGPEGRSVASVPATAWLDDGSLVVLDNRRPPTERTFEKLNPVTGQKRSIVDSARALADLRRAVEGMNVDALPWPLAFDASARHALYIFNGDVFVLELNSARFRRLTSTPAEETAASFSPNGRRVAYVRNNDLYFFDLDTNRDGGFMTLNLMTRSQEFKAGISVAPIVDWRYYDTKWTEGAMRTPQENPNGYESTSLIPLAKQLHGRLLIVYGTYDDNVHPYNELAFIDALIAAGKKFEMMAYPMRKHGIADEAATLHLYRLMLDFWKANL